MKMQKIATLFGLMMIVSMLATVAITPVQGQSYTGHKKTYAYIGATPNPVAVGEEVLVHLGISEALQITQDKWFGLTVTVTKPDGTTQTLGPFNTDSTGGTGTILVPDQEGTYKLQTHFPAQWYNYSTNDLFLGQQTVRCYYESSDSEVLTLIVGAEASQFWPGFSLPTEYWSRPIDSQIREWYSVSGSWLSPGSYGGAEALGQDDAPETAHIIWQKQLQIGGLAGGTGISEPAAVFPGDAYEGKFSNSLVIMGVLIYQKFDSVGESVTTGGTNLIGAKKVDNWIVAVDIHTGETLWEKALYDPNGNRVVPQYGQVMYWKSFNTQGVYPILFCGVSGGFFGGASSTLEAFDPYTGRWLFEYQNMPSGTRMYGPNGEIIIYTLNQQAGYMTIWNSSSVIDAYWGTTENSPMFGSYQPQGKIINATGKCPVTYATPFGYNGYTHNITIPKGLLGSAQLIYPDDVIVGYQRLETSGMFTVVTLNDAPFVLWGIDAKTGALKFNKTIAAPAGNVTLSVSTGSQDDRVIVIWSKELRQFWAYSIDNGNLVWGPTPAQNYLDIFAMYPRIYNHILYSNGMSGIMYAYDAKTGNLLWNYTYKDPWSETLWSDYWSSLRPRIIADGKIYLGQSEHSVNQPQPRGAPFVCLNATTGEVIWQIAGLFRQTDWGGSAVMGDSIIATMDSYNQMVYAIGKGATATTVSAPDTSVEYGKAVTIKGTVTDVSPGTADEKIKLRFPNGVAAVSDDSMSDWMLYVYKQFNRPTNASGVQVSINVIDSNGNYRTIGTTTSSPEGFFSYTWTPDISGEYKVYAVFEGSNGYYGSRAENAFTVEEEAQPTATTQPSATIPPYETYIIAMGVAIIVALALATLLIIKKKP
jgi:hypothetical protein